MFSIDTGPLKIVVVNDLDTMRDILEGNSFLGRGVSMDENDALTQDIKAMRGGHGFHGIIGAQGDEWKEQRRFALQHLKDFGFGKSKMESAIMEEALELCEDIRNKIKLQGNDINIGMSINVTVLNVLWRIVASKRYDTNDTAQLDRLTRINKLFALFGFQQISLVLVSLIPDWLRHRMPTNKFILDEFSFFFQMAQDEYDEHLKTYDEGNMRDFVDCYIRERKRTEEENDVKSSFYGDNGHWNFKNVIFDLFLAGSETTTTTLHFALIFLLHNPGAYAKAKEELDKVVGSTRNLTMADKDDLHYLNALIAEIQRCGNVAPFAVNHGNFTTARIGDYVIPPGRLVCPNLSAILSDPKHFENPSKFQPERFLDETGSFKPHPALIPFGIGKRYCPGKNLAHMELFLFLGTLIQHFEFLPSSDGLPDHINCHIGVTRVPKPYRVKITSRF